MKRILLLIVVLIATVQCHAKVARNIIVTRWSELIDRELYGNDCIIKVDPTDIESNFSMKKTAKGTESNDFKQATVLNEKITETTADEDLWVTSAIKSAEDFEIVEKPAQEGVRYYVEEDSWWTAKIKNTQTRRIVLVPVNQRNAWWRTVTVIAPHVVWNGYGRIGQCVTHYSTEEYRFSNPLKLAALLGMGAGIYAFIHTW